MSLHEHGFQSTRFHEFETELKTMRLRSAYTGQMVPWESSPSKPRSPKSRVMSQDLLSYTTNIKDVLLFSKNAVDG